MQNLDLSYKEIYPKIFVYSNLFPDHKTLHGIMNKSEKNSQGKGFYSEWTDWFIFGRYCSSRYYKFAIEDMKQSFKDGIEYDFDLYEEELLLHNRLNEAVTAAICNYVAINDVRLPENSYISDQNIARYNPGVDSGEGKTMQYHTDYGIGEWYWPGEKFLLTATTYMNDDYEGGEIMFSIGDEIIKYKPQAGEIIVFPSGSPLFPGGEPYFHAVGGIKNSSKSLVRMYLKHTASGEKKWYDGEEKYGKEEWYEIAKKKAEGHNSIAVFDNVPRLCSALITKLYGIEKESYTVKEDLFYDQDEI
jgi:hypothetical protein